MASDGTFLGTDDKEGVLGGGEANMSSSQLCWFVDNKGKASSVPTKMGFHDEKTLSATLRLLIHSGKLKIYIYIAMENGPFEDVCPIKNGDIPLLC